MSERDAIMSRNEAGAIPVRLWGAFCAAIARFNGAVSALPFCSRLLWAFSFPAVLGASLVGVVFYVGRAFSVDPDLWWHVKVGERILATHHWPTSDHYSFTVAGTPWIAYQWLGDVLFAAVARMAGMRGLCALLIILGSAVMLSLYVYSTLRSGNSKAGFLSVGILSPLAIVSFTLRPQMIGYLFIVITLIILERVRQGRSGAVWFLPPLMLVWINTHGSWIMGLGVIVVFWGSGLVECRLGGIEGRRWSTVERIRLELVLLLCFAVVPLTPYGARLAASPFEYVFELPLNKAHILEWQPMPFSMNGGKLFLVLLIAFIIAQVALRLTWRLEELVLFLGGTAMACLHVRFILLFVPFFAPLLATIIARWLPPYRREKDHYILNAVLMLAIVAGMVRYFPGHAVMRENIARQFPVRAVEYLRQNPVPGPMYNNYGYGGYLVWSRPESKVFIDGRGDVYERAGVFSDYLTVAYVRPASFALLRSYGIQSCLIERSETLATVLAALPEWQQVYSDDVSVLFVRQKAANKPAGAVQADNKHGRGAVMRGQLPHQPSKPGL